MLDKDASPNGSDYSLIINPLESTDPLNVNSQLNSINYSPQGDKQSCIAPPRN